jgi:hypothetical protein
MAALLLLGTGAAWAQDGDGDNAETTIRLMGDADAELPDVVINDISLPEAATVDLEAISNARKGLDVANEKRAQRNDGLRNASEARERASEMADEARGNVENRGRAEDLPGDVPGRPDRPERPERPETPQPPGS